MATASQADITLTGEWVDAVVGNGSLASTDVFLQNVGGNAAHVYFGGSKPSESTVGVKLAPGDSVTGNAAAIWVRAAGQAGKLSAATI